MQRRCRERIRKRGDRLENEVNDVDERLRRELEFCDQFRSGQEHVELAHCSCKWLDLNFWPYPTHDVVFWALNKNKHSVYIDIRASIIDNIAQFFAMIRNATSCILIYLDMGSIPATIELPPNILSISPIGISLSVELERTLERNQSQPGKKTTIGFSNMRVYDRALTAEYICGSLTLRFFGPPSDFLTL